ncbi:MAG: UvrD-helicase domain-containing protein, partial [Planctomycetota bacterium]
MTAKRPPDRLGDEAARAAILNALDRNILVEAAAGTGKTTSMVGRMLALLRTGACNEIRTLAAVTFTRKAASELRARFQAALEAAVRNAAGGERERLRAALAGIEECFIGTIHAFSARLLRERPVEAGVGLDFRELDEAEDEGLRKAAWDAYVAGLFVRDPEGAIRGLKSVNLAPGMLESAFIAFAEYPDVEEWPLPDGGRAIPRLEEAWRAVREYVAHMAEMGERLPASWGRDALVPEYRRLPRLLAHYRDLRAPDELADFLTLFDKEAGIVQKEWSREGAFTKEEAKAERERWQAFREEVARPFLGEWRERCYGPVLRALLGARSVYDRLRRERGALNFPDLLLRAAGLLRDHAHIRRYFRRRFTHLLVDEFQDTDPVQAEVMLLLTAENPEERDWHRARPAAGALFVVGDPKQSIYRFRRADIATYNAVKQVFQEDEHGLVLELSTNFRAEACLIDWTNRVFRPAFPARATEESPAYVPLVGSRASAPEALSGIRVLRIPEERSRSNEDAVAYEAERIARFIRHALEKGLRLPRTERERAHGVPLEARPSDFLIVTRYTKNLPAYARALRDLRIPCRVTGGAVLNAIEELKLLHLFLFAATRPEDTVALVAALRSQLFGLSDAALYAYKKAGGRWAYASRAPEGLAPSDARAFEDAFQSLRLGARRLAGLPILAAVEKSLSDLGLLARAAAREGGAEEAGGLYKALELLRGAEPECLTALDLVDALGALVRGEENHDGVSALGDEPDAVRLMNLHKVKGLEGGVVFLADPTGEKRRPVGMHIDRSGDRARGFLAVTDGRSSHREAVLARAQGWEDYEARERAFLDAEETRLRYVAATRARALLVVSRRARGNHLNPWRAFEEVLEKAEELFDPGPQEPLQEKTSPAAPAEARAAGEDRARALARALHRTYDVQAAKSYALRTSPVDGALPETPFPAGMPFLGGEAESAPVLESSDEELAWGALLHALLERSLQAPATDLEAAARALLPEHGLDAKLAPQAAGIVRSVMRSALWQRARASDICLAEAPFHRRIDAGADESRKGREGPVPLLLRGVIDLVFREGDGWVLVDY